jgi:hypothetical protein
MSTPTEYETTCPDCGRQIGVDSQGLFVQHRVKPVEPDKWGGPVSYREIGADNPWCASSRMAVLDPPKGSVHGMQGGLPTLGKRRR